MKKLCINCQFYSPLTYRELEVARSLLGDEADAKTPAHRCLRKGTTDLVTGVRTVEQILDCHVERSKEGLCGEFAKYFEKLEK